LLRQREAALLVPWRFLAAIPARNVSVDVSCRARTDAAAPVALASLSAFDEIPPAEAAVPEPVSLLAGAARERQEKTSHGKAK
jgi:hypothetical protein